MSFVLTGGGAAPTDGRRTTAATGRRTGVFGSAGVAYPRVAQGVWQENPEVTVEELFESPAASIAVFAEILGILGVIASVLYAAYKTGGKVQQATDEVAAVSKSLGAMAGSVGQLRTDVDRDFTDLKSQLASAEEARRRTDDRQWEALQNHDARLAYQGEAIAAIAGKATGPPPAAKPQS